MGRECSLGISFGGNGRKIYHRYWEPNRSFFQNKIIVVKPQGFKTNLPLIWMNERNTHRPLNRKPNRKPKQNSSKKI